MLNNNKVVVLCSGGLDSLVTSELYRHLGYEVTLLYVNYGNRNHSEENSVVNRYASKYDLKWYWEEAKMSFYEPLLKKKQLFVPARNLMLLSMGVALAESIGASTVALGVINVGDDPYPDCSEEFLEAIDNTAFLCSEVSVVAPLRFATKDKVVKMAIDFGLDLDEMYTCENPTLEGEPCGLCVKCKDFEEAKTLVQNLK